MVDQSNLDDLKGAIERWAQAEHGADFVGSFLVLADVSSISDTGENLSTWAQAGLGSPLTKRGLVEAWRDDDRKVGDE